MDFEEIIHFEILGQKLGQGGFSSVYLAEKDGQKFAVKVFQDEALGRREAAQLARMKHPALVQVFSLCRVPSGQLGMAMEYIDGSDLVALLQENRLAWPEAVQIGIQIASALEEIHRNGLVHRDVKPRNILVKLAGDAVKGRRWNAKLIDFGLAVGARKEDASSNERVGFAGTVIYSSPEQTGLLARVVDSRSDLYSLGVVLFELLTGRLPFRSQDAAGLMKEHVSGEIPLASSFTSELSPFLTGVVAKLMSKDPDDRYATAEGVVADLEKALDPALQSGGAEVQAVFDSRNCDSTRLYLNQNAGHFRSSFVGRRDELARIKVLFQETRKGSLQSLLITGEAGVGKSRLLDELIRHADTLQSGRSSLVLWSTLSARGSGEQQESFALFKFVLEQLIQRIRRGRRQGWGQEAAWTERLGRAVKGIFPILSRLSPNLSQVLGDQEGATDDASYTAEQLQESLYQFFRRLGQSLSPLIFLVENVQWIDENSLKVIKLLLTRQERCPLLLLMTCRTQNHAEGVIPVERLLSGDVGGVIHLVPLLPDELSKSVSEYFGVDRGLPREAVSYFWNRSHGNPFLLTELMEGVIDRGQALAVEKAWQFDLQAMERGGLSQSVQELILERIKNIPQRIISLLKIASVLGSPFSAKFLPELAELTAGEVHGLLSEALPTHAFEKRRDAIHEHFEEAEFVFSSQEVIQYFLSLMTPYEISNIRRKIVSLWTRSYETEGRASSGGDERDYWMRLAYQCNAILGDQDPKTCFNANFKAAQALKSVGDGKLAWGHIRQTMTLIAAHPELDPSYEYYLLAGNLATGYDTPIVAIKLFRQGLVKLEEAFPKVSVRPSQERSHALSLFLQGIAVAEAGEAQEDWSYAPFQDLIEKGTHVRLPTATPLQLKIALLYARCGSLLNFFRPKPRDPFEGDLLFDITLPLRSVLLVHTQWREALVLSSFLSKYESSVQSSSSLGFHYCFCGTILGLLGFQNAARDYGEKVKQHLDRVKDPTSRATMFFYYIFICGLSGRSQFAESLLSQANREDTKWMPATISLFIANIQVLSTLVWKGKSQTLLVLTKELERALALYYPPEEENSGDFGIAFNFRILRDHLTWAAHSQLGNVRESSHFKKKYDEFFQGKEDWKGLFWVHCGGMAYFLLEQDESDAKIDGLVERFEKHSEINRGSFDAISILVPLLHLRLRQYQRAIGEGRSVRLKQLLTVLQLTEDVVKRPLLRAHSSLIRATLMLEKGHLFRFRSHLKQASAVALQEDAPWVHFEVHLLWASYYEKKKDLSRQAYHTQVALGLAQQQGWKGRIAKLRRDLEYSRSTSPSSGVTTTSLSSVELSGSVGGQYPRLKKNLAGILDLLLTSDNVLRLEKQIEAALRHCVTLVLGERVILFRVSGLDFSPFLALGSSGQLIERPSHYSRKMIEEVVSSDKSLFYGGVESDQAWTLSESVVIHDLRSVLAVPVRVKGKVEGVLYCDSRIARGVFSSEDLDVLGAIANYISFIFSANQSANLELEKIALQKDVEANQKIKAAYDALDAATRDIRAIFGSIEQGICTLNEELEIQGEFSSFLTQLVGDTDLKEKSFVELVLKKSDLTSDQVEVARTVISTSVGEVLQFGYEVNARNLPRSFKLTSSKGKSVFIELDWIPLVSHGGIVQSVMCTLRDVTLMRELREQTKRQQEDLEILGELFGLTAMQFSFFSDAEGLLTSSPSLEKLTRDLHSLKGMARVFGLKLVASVLHEAEERLKDLQKDLKKGGKAVEESVREVCQPVLDALGRYRAVLDQKLRLSQKLESEKGDSLGWVSAQRAIEPLRDSLPELAKTLAKAVPRLGLLEGEGLEWKQEFSNRFVSILNHLIRNSLDHGFETGQAESPLILLEVMDTNLSQDRIRFRYFDNGRGLNLAKLAERYRVRSQGKNAPWSVIADQIFERGISTRDQVTEISGRGIGMDAFRAQIEEWGGRVEVRLLKTPPSLPCCPFELRFELPFSLYFRRAGLSKKAA